MGSSVKDPRPTPVLIILTPKLIMLVTALGSQSEAFRKTRLRAAGSTLVVESPSIQTWLAWLVSINDMVEFALGFGKAVLAQVFGVSIALIEQVEQSKLQS
jgi:hypothetical protein